VRIECIEGLVLRLAFWSFAYLQCGTTRRCTLYSAQKHRNNSTRICWFYWQSLVR